MIGKFGLLVMVSEIPVELQTLQFTLNMSNIRADRNKKIQFFYHVQLRNFKKELQAKERKTTPALGDSHADLVPIVKKVLCVF